MHPAINVFCYNPLMNLFFFTIPPLYVLTRMARLCVISPSIHIRSNTQNRREIKDLGREEHKTIKSLGLAIVWGLLNIFKWVCVSGLYMCILSYIFRCFFKILVITSFSSCSLFLWLGFVSSFIADACFFSLFFSFFFVFLC